MRAVKFVTVLVALAIAAVSMGQLASAERSRATLDGCIRSGPGVAIVKLKVDRLHSMRAAVLGRSQAGVVISNQSDQSLCDWLPYARDLTGTGFTVLLYDYGPEGYRAAIRAAVTKLRQRGTRHVALLGSSQGAKVSIYAAAKKHTRVAGVISLSAERYLGGMDIKPYVARVHRPIIFFTAQDDPYGAAQASRLFYHVCPSTSKKLVMLAGDLHGADILTGPDGRSVKQQIRDFLSTATSKSS